MITAFRLPRGPLLAALAFAALTAPVGLPAQGPGAQSSVAISIRVQPALAIDDVVRRATRLDAAGRLTATSVVNVQSDLPYRLTVRLSPAAASGAARVHVRSATGSFEPVTPGRTVLVAVGVGAVRREHEIACRAEATTPELPAGDACALIHELSAEYHDTLLRTVAMPSDGALR